MDIDPDLIAFGAAYQRNKQLKAQQELLKIARDRQLEEKMQQHSARVTKYKEQQKKNAEKEEREEKELLGKMSPEQKTEYLENKRKRDDDNRKRDDEIKKRWRIMEEQRKKAKALQGQILLWTIGIIIALFVGLFVYINISGK